MSPTQKRGATLSRDLESLRSILRGTTPESYLIHVPGESSGLSFSDAARRTNSKTAELVQSIDSTIADSLLLCDAPNAPILAVLGLLNAGKSSLVCSFLSPENQKRVLIGSSNVQGTHRFVLWLPLAWKKNDAIWSHIQSRLNAVFGTSLELLDDDPAQAIIQYNDTRRRQVNDNSSGNRSVSPMETPLVGFDSALDRWGVALMDCPDVQTGLLPEHNLTVTRDHLASAVEQVAQQRLQLLAKVSPFCSAFVIVLPANAMHDEKVSRLMHLIQERMPSTPQIAAVNRVPRRYTTAEIQKEIADLYGSERLHRVYMAYGFDGPNLRERIPSPPVMWAIEQQNQLPLFFRIDADPLPQPPTPVNDDHWLLRIGGQLDKSQLLDGSIDSQLARLHAETSQALFHIKQWSEDQSKKRRSLRESLAAACVEFSRDPSAPDQLRLQASKHIIDQIAKSLERTAPWWATPGRWVARLAEFGKSQVSNMTQWIRLPEWITGKTEGLVRFIRGRWSSGNDAKIVTSESFVAALARQDGPGFWELDRNDPLSVNQRAEILKVVQLAIDRFQAESQITLESSDLDQCTKRMWENMPLTKRFLTGVAPAAVLFAPLIAVLAIPVDFGGSSVLVFASLKELLGAGLAGIGIALLSADSMPRLAESQAAWQQFGDLVALLCDGFGFERPSRENSLEVILGGTKRTIPISPLPIEPAAVRESLQHLIPHEFQLQTATVQRIESLLQSLRK